MNEQINNISSPEYIKEEAGINLPLKKSSINIALKKA